MRGLRTPVGRAVAALLALGLLAVVAERQRWFGRLLAAGSPERLWIWAAVPQRHVVPRAFFAVRDFHLAAVPGAAQLEIQGDAEYVSWLNGRQVGSGRFRAGAPIDAYPVVELLRPGANRWIVELRSAIGSGGMTGRIVDGEGRTLVASDGEWRIHEGRAWRALLRGEAPPPAPAARVLGRAPIGRWGQPATAPLRPPWSELIVDFDGRLAKRYRRAEPGASWRRARSAVRRRRMPDPVRIELAEEGVGYLHLDLARDSSRTGLVRFDASDAGRVGWLPDVVVVAVPHNAFWQDVEPRAFRSLDVVGLDGLLAARIVPVDPSVVRRLGPAPPPRDLSGAPVEPPRTPVVDEIWKRAGLGGGPEATADGR